MCQTSQLVATPLCPPCHENMPQQVISLRFKNSSTLFSFISNLYSFFFSLLHILWLFLPKIGVLLGMFNKKQKQICFLLVLLLRRLVRAWSYYNCACGEWSCRQKCCCCLLQNYQEWWRASRQLVATSTKVKIQLQC